MLTKFYRRYLQLQKDIKKHPLTIIKDGHTFFDIKVADLGEKTGVSLTPTSLDRLEQKDFKPIYRVCNYAYSWFSKTFRHLKDIKLNYIRHPDQDNQDLPDINNVNYDDCCKMIYHKAYQKAAHQKILPQNWDSSTPLKVKNTVRNLEDPLPNKDIYQNLVADESKKVNKFLSYIHRMAKQNFLI